MEILENKSIFLRAVEPEDIDIIYNWENNSELWHLSNAFSPFSKYLIKKYVESTKNDLFEEQQLRLVIEIKEKNTPIGLIDLFDFDFHNSRVGVGILINDKDYRKRGFASESLETLINYCFKFLKINQLYCNILTDNQESISLFKKFGFTISGTKKSWVKTPEGYKDEYFLQLFNS